LRLAQTGAVYVALPGYEDHPMVLVTWFGARAYCQFYGWRLPTDTEWEKAARGTNGRPFPWGDQASPRHANYYHSQDPFEPDPAAVGGTTPVGFFNGQTTAGYATLDAASPYGLYDMAGNVWQWTADVHPGTHDRSLRGGSKDTYAFNLRAWTRNSAPPDYASPGAGFRCARDAGGE
jgi:formylglycine-generating enzyme required for sulfatase activity